MATEAPARPQAEIMEALIGEISNPVTTTSYKPNLYGQTVETRIVERGSGMVLLEDAADNKEWSGMFNHFTRAARLATFLGEQLKAVGETVDTGIILNTILVSHAGRRQYDEACWYPQIVENADEKSKAGDQVLTTRLLQELGVAPEIMEVVAAHGLGGAYPFARMDTWEKKLAMYADFRTGQTINSVEERFADLQKRGIEERVAKGEPPRYSQELLDNLKAWATTTEQEIFSKLTINPEDITNENPTTPRWERYLRTLYQQDAQEDIFARLTQLHIQLRKGDITKEEFDILFQNEFPQNNWWGEQAVHEYEILSGIPYQTHGDKPIGIERAINFFHYLDTLGHRETQIFPEEETSA